jgi:hypothetical protein
MRTRRPNGVFDCTFGHDKIVEGIRLVNSGANWHEAAKAVGMCIENLRERAAKAGLQVRVGKRSFRFGETRLNLPTEPTDLAYLAGILDGEGSISICGSPRNVVRVGISNTDEGLIKWLASIGGGVSKKTPSPNCKQCYHWQVYSRFDVRAFLIAVVPYMRIKQNKAILAIETITSWVEAHEEFLSIRV